MINIADAIEKAVDLAGKADWRVAAGIAGLAVLAGVGRWGWRKVKQK